MIPLGPIVAKIPLTESGGTLEWLSATIMVLRTVAADWQMGAKMRFPNRLLDNGLPLGHFEVQDERGQTFSRPIWPQRRPVLRMSLPLQIRGGHYLLGATI